MHGVGGAGGLECKVQGSRFKSHYGMSVDRTQAMAARFSMTASPNNNPTEHKPIYSDLLNCLCKSVCIVGCWKSSLLAKRIPRMHVNNISDSNFNSNLITLMAHVVLALCYLCWWSFLPPTSAFTLVHMWF